MNINRPTRRRLLKSLGAGLALAPILPYVGARADGAATTPRNLLLVYHPNGLEEGWMPTGGPVDFALGDILSPLESMRERMLIAAGFKSGISNEILAHNEGMVTMWTGKRQMGNDGYSEYPSIDQIVADELAGLAPFRSLEFGVQTVAGTSLSNTTAMCYRDGEPLQAEDDPAQMYDRIFGTTGEDPAQLRAERKSIFDATRGALDDVRAAYGAEDRARIDKHVDLVRETELRLEALDELSCEAAGQPADDGNALATNGALFEAAAEAQMDLITACLSCGITRVASLQYGNSTTTVPIAGHPMHSIMHSGTREQKLEINGWFVQQLAALLQRLNAVTFEDGTTLLDDTLVVWGTEMAIGNHLNAPLPYIIAGGGSTGWFSHGKFVDFGAGGGSDANRPRHTRMLVSVLHAMGLDDITQVGDFDGPQDIGPLDELARVS